MIFQVKLRRTSYETAIIEVEGKDEEDVNEKVDELLQTTPDEIEWRVEDCDDAEIDDMQVK